MAERLQPAPTPPNSIDIRKIPSVVVYAIRRQEQAGDVRMGNLIKGEFDIPSSTSGQNLLDQKAVERQEKGVLAAHQIGNGARYHTSRAHEIQGDIDRLQWMNMNSREKGLKRHQYTRMRDEHTRKAGQILAELDEPSV